METAYWRGAYWRFFGTNCHERNVKRENIFPRKFSASQLVHVVWANRSNGHSIQLYNVEHEERVVPEDLQCRGVECAGRFLGRRTRTRVGARLRFTPNFVYAYCPLVDSLRHFYSRDGFEGRVNGWRDLCAPTNSHVKTYLDVFDGAMWSRRQRQFLSQENSLGLILNLDWFQPYEKSPISIGAIYVAILNLPRTMRFKPENVAVIGMIPFLNGEPKSVDSFIQPLIDELLKLEEGVVFLQNVIQSTYLYGYRDKVRHHIRPVALWMDSESVALRRKSALP